MKKLIITPLLFLLFNLSAFSQQLVFDPTVVSTLVINHTAQQEVLKDIKESESEISAAQKTIALKMEQIRVLEEKMYKSLSTVSAVVQNAKDIIYASEIAEDIGRYQKEMMQIAGEDPELLLAAAKTEVELINRSVDLLVYIDIALLGTDANLLDNKQRLDIITHVIEELRVMRGIAYGISRRMKVARSAGLLKSLNPYRIKYPDNGAAIVKSLLEEIKK